MSQKRNHGKHPKKDEDIEKREKTENRNPQHQQTNARDRYSSDKI